MPALNARSRPALRIVASAEPRKPQMPVTVKLPEDFGATVDSLLARVRQVQTATRGFTTEKARRGVLLDLEAIEQLAATAREAL